jgi:cell division protein ZapA
MDDKLSIKVNIAERYYPLRIVREEEEKIRKAARLINEKILQYKQRYTDKDTQDFVAMAALQFVIQYIELENNTGSSAFEESLKELSSELESFLKTE